MYTTERMCKKDSARQNRALYMIVAITELLLRTAQAARGGHALEILSTPRECGLTERNRVIAAGEQRGLAST